VPQTAVGLSSSPYISTNKTLTKSKNHPEPDEPGPIDERLHWGEEEAEGYDIACNQSEKLTTCEQVSTPRETSFFLNQATSIVACSVIFNLYELKGINTD
jgi:hypothetical protein